MSRTPTHPETCAPAALFQHARWIWPVSYNWDIHNTYALFRRSFHLETVPAEALLHITADQSYQLYVNGTYVARGPARGFQLHWPYDALDLAPYLKPGRNVLAIRAYNPGFSTFQYLTQGFAGLLLAADWGDVQIHSDASWRSRRQTGVQPATVPSSLQLFSQEHIDLREEDPDWMQPGYDDSSWVAPVALHQWNGMPWNDLEPRGIPQLEESLLPAPHIIGHSEGSCLPGYRDSRDIPQIRQAEGFAHDRVDLTAERITVPATGVGRYASYLFDYGRTVVGSFGLEVVGARGGEIVDTLHCETVDPTTLAPHYFPERGSRMSFGNRLVCRGGDQSHTFYHIYGFRYVVVTVRDTVEDITIRPHLRSALYPLEEQSRFVSSDAGLNAIWQTCTWTQRVCSLDAYVDTPGREQVQWWGDARVQAKNTFFYSGDTRLFRRGLAQIATQVAPSGLTYGHAPTMAHTCILPDFTLMWFITLWDYYWQTGSLEPFQAHQATIRTALAYFEKFTNEKTGLLVHDDRYWLFLDWSDIRKDGSSSVYNLWLLIALERLAELYRLSGSPAEATRLQSWATRTRAALSRLTNEDGLLHDGLKLSGEVMPETSIHAQTLAIIAALHPQHDAVRVERVILPFVRERIESAVTPSCYWITYVFEVLTSSGHGEAVLDFIREKWAPMAAYGTTWEVFNPKVGEESFSHAWSAHPLYHLMQILGGIRQTGARWTEVEYHPYFQGDHADVLVPTPHGPIHSRWQREGDTIHASLSLPDGITAIVHLPNQRVGSVTGTTSWQIKTSPLSEVEVFTAERVLAR